MKIELTEKQIQEIKEEKGKQEQLLKDLPKIGYGWEKIDCKNSIIVLDEIIKSGKIDVYGN